jgi:hypothetical protein
MLTVNILLRVSTWADGTAPPKKLLALDFGVTADDEDDAAEGSGIEMTIGFVLLGNNSPSVRGKTMESNSVESTILVRHESRLRAVIELSSLSGEPLASPLPSLHHVFASGASQSAVICGQ